MKIVKNQLIDGKNAQMIVKDDNTVEVIYDNKTIFSSGENTWNNIKDEEWLINGTIHMLVESYTEKHKEPNEIFKQLCRELV